MGLRPPPEAAFPTGRRTSGGRVLVGRKEPCAPLSGGAAHGAGVPALPRPAALRFPPVETAGDAFVLRIQRGRLLRGWALALACALRNLVTDLSVGGWGNDDVAPSWVVVTDRRTGARVGRVSAGREPGAVDALFTAMEYDAAFLAPLQFIERYQVK